MKIVALHQDRSACGTIRISQPANKIKSLGLAEVHVSGLGDREIDKAFDECDVVFMGRAASDTSLKFVMQLQKLGKKVVYDLDDNMFDISPMSPHYKQLGVMAMEMPDPNGGAPAPMWTHGVDDFDVSKNRIIRRDFINIIRQVDAVTVTTEPLAKVYRRFNDSVHVVPNSVDFCVWEKPDVKWGRDEIRIVYTGAANHQEDWMFIQPVLADLQKRYPKLVVVTVGMDWRYLKNDLDLERVEVHGWEDISAYPWMMKSLCGDIGIAPIEMTPFNDCRSSIKWIEYAAMKTAVVATDYGPYRRDVENGKTGLLVKTKEEWNKALTRLIEDEAYRRQLGANAYSHCKLKHNLDFVVDEWMKVFAEAVK